jgi:2-polyprenyl-3-methyl-5-hydroxy-6-metoxy-1,4-benzoquinol methylase
MAVANDTDLDWRSWGNANPYFGVISHAQFLNANLSSDSLQDFFASGERHIDHIYDVIRSANYPNFEPARVLDYGCGVGRLVVPLARRSQTVFGVDVSPGMLAEASHNCNRFGVTSARLIDVDEFDSLKPRSFDLVHSFIVFQHIPVPRGEVILRKLISLLSEGGIGAIHYTFSYTRSTLRQAVRALRQRVNVVHGLLNLVKRRPFSTPMMQMNNYSMNHIFDILMSAQCSLMHVDFSDHSGHHGAMLYFRKSPAKLL